MFNACARAAATFTASIFPINLQKSTTVQSG